MVDTLVPNILIVDDIEANLFVMKKLLSKHNANIYTAISGMKAIEYVKNNHFALILLDIQMPIMDGFEAAKTIYSLPNGKNIPIIFVTAHYKSDESILKGYDSGAVDYLVKPVDSHVLNKKVKRFLQINTEMLEKKSLIDELEKTKSHLMKTNEKLRDYTHLIAHDMKEPLRGIFNYIDMLLDDYKNKFDEEIKKKLGTIQLMSKHALSLTESMLEYSQIDLMNKKAILVDLNNLVDEVLEFIGLYIEESGATVEKGNTLPSVYVDPYLASNIFRNLIVNAIKYADGKGNSIKIGYDRENSIFFVSDHGIGIPAKQFEKIFLPLKRLHGKDEYGGGAGFGLSMVKKIVELYGGSIWLESTLGSGTTFFFTLPGCVKTSDIR